MGRVTTVTSLTLHAGPGGRHKCVLTGPCTSHAWKDLSGVVGSHREVGELPRQFSWLVSLTGLGFSDL